MAFKQNILRAAKLKTISQVTQAVERHFDWNAPYSSLTNGAEDDNIKPTMWVPCLPGPFVQAPQSLQNVVHKPSSVICHESAQSCVSLPTLGFMVGDKDRKANDVTVSPPPEKPNQSDPSRTTLSFQSLQCPCGFRSCKNPFKQVVGAISRGCLLEMLRSRHSSISLAPENKTTQHVRRHSIEVSNPASREVRPEESDILLFSAGLVSQSKSKHVLSCSAASGDGGKGLPSMDQLKAAEDYFLDKMPRFFKDRLEYHVYHKNITFENNFWGYNETSVGIAQYSAQLTKLRVMSHVKYAHIHLDVLSSACLVGDGCVRLHWRISVLSQFKALRFWKYNPWNYRKALKEDSEWIEGISTFWVNQDGLVTKHRLDRMTPIEPEVSKANLALKISALLGLSAPKPILPGCCFLSQRPSTIS